MSRIDVAQQSPDWFALRNTRIGASEAAICLGKSPYETPLQMYMRKLGLAPEKPDNPAMAFGRNNESIAREWAEREFNCTFEPAVFQADMSPWMIASLDGYNETKDGRSALIEIKCMGFEAHHDIVNSGKIPEHYNIQIQAQLYCSGAQKAYLVSYCPSYPTPFDAEEVQRDDDLIEQIVIATYDMQKRIEQKEPPEPTDKDYLPMDNDEFLCDLLDDYRALKESIEQSTEEMGAIKNQITKYLSDQKILAAKCGVSKIQYQTRKGQVDYSKIEALSEINLEQYRKPPTKSWVIR